MSMEMLSIPLALIKLGDRLREVDPDRVAELANSIAETGQIAPIEVTPADAGGRHDLISGAHRLAALKLAGIETAVAVIFDGDEDQQRLHEIDENLYRHELTPFDQATFLAERRAIFERLQGAVKPGRRKTIGAHERQLSFFDETTGKFGLSRDTIERALRRHSLISDAAWRLLRTASLRRSGRELDALAKVPKANQAAVVQLLLNAERSATADAPRTVAEARRIVLQEREPQDEERAYRAALGAFDRLSAAHRRRFIDHLVEMGHLDSVRP